MNILTPRCDIYNLPNYLQLLIAITVKFLDVALVVRLCENSKYFVY